MILMCLALTHASLHPSNKMLPQFKNTTRHPYMCLLARLKADDSNTLLQSEYPLNPDQSPLMDADTDIPCEQSLC